MTRKRNDDEPEQSSCESESCEDESCESGCKENAVAAQDSRARSAQSKQSVVQKKSQKDVLDPQNKLWFAS